MNGDVVIIDDTTIEIENGNYIRGLDGMENSRKNWMMIQTLGDTITITITILIDVIGDYYGIVILWSIVMNCHWNW